MELLKSEKSAKGILIKDSMRQWMKNYLLSSRCVRCLVMPKRLVNREELGRVIAQTSVAITMIDDLHYGVRSASGDHIYTVTVIKSGWTCSCPDYARHNAKCKHVYAVEFYRSQSATF
jgi:hypothetical protein